MQESTVSMISVLLQLKDKNQNQPKGGMHRARNGKVLNTKLLSPSVMFYPPSTSMCDNTQNVVNQGISPEFWCPKFLLRFNYAGMLN